jgi:hypothetical protein
VSGVVGELHVGGVCLARGYFQRAGLTAEKFIPHPFSQEPSARLYRTGDLARWLPDGTLEYLGRVDAQVKVRGYRIEPVEIEGVLLTHEAVRDAVVIVREGATYTSHGGGREAGAWSDGERAGRAHPDAGDKQLVGYVVVESGAPVDEVVLIQELRSLMQEQLPGYMVPSVLTVLESLPLTVTGKVDRKALPAPEVPMQAEYTPPQGVTEELLSELWCVLLKRERVGRHDNFFELGGHSLLVTQLASRIRKTFSTELLVREVFEYATLASQASAVERALRASTPVDLPIEPASRDEPLPLSYAQQRMLFLHEYMK